MSGLAVFDTSIFVGQESRGLLVTSDWVPIVAFPTIAELQLGVMLAEARGDDTTRVMRQITLDSARKARLVGVTTAPDDLITVAWCTLRVALKRAIPANDSWIAATALALGLPVLTQDDDYDAASDLIEVVRL